MDLPFIVVVVVGEGAALKGNVPIVDLLLLLGHGGPQLEAVDVYPSQDTLTLLS